MRHYTMPPTKFIPPYHARFDSYRAISDLIPCYESIPYAIQMLEQRLFRWNTGHQERAEARQMILCRIMHAETARIEANEQAARIYAQAKEMNLP